MDHITHRGHGHGYEDPGVWTVPAGASEASVTMPTRGEPEELCRLGGLAVSFALRPTGLLAGFTVRLALPPTAGRPSSLSWESIELTHERAQELHGRGRILLGTREAWAPLTGTVLEIPCQGSARPYLKIMLTTRFHASTLAWPAEARWRPRQVSLRFFSEIRPIG